ncbi:MAG: hypothetical protein QOJ91_3080 [Sphingomonadales bacterium]|jgi:hypothetical protein|nr:hypothetical protein [Sphingomonadales bacterium]
MSLNDSSSRRSGLGGRARRRQAGGTAGSAPAGGGSALAITPGMAMVQNAVQFTNDSVLDPTKGLSGTILPTGMQVGANALADQAGAMMIQDVRSFLQSMEMIMVPAAAAALSEALADQPAGAVTLELIQSTMVGLATFAGDVITMAGTTKAVFE